MDRQKSRQYARLDAFYKSEALTSKAYLSFVEQQYSYFNQMRSLSTLDILQWLNLTNVPIRSDSLSITDLRLSEICLFLLKEVLLELMDQVFRSKSPCSIPDILRRRHVQRHRRLPYSGRRRRVFP